MFKILFLIFSPFACKAFPPITEKVVPQMFRNNSAKQGLIFPEKHPYFTKVPAESKKEYKNPPMLIFYTITDKIKNPL